ncbi:Protein split ends [Portunus trituberculatus]|uniref:Protein split ends n=1 Tax=Portunus trituberculatus TaxID=210409 RepID=A0A5B7CW59_PORTR|nr:Protein split ends [Portunus trituberculatus]
MVVFCVCRLSEEHSGYDRSSHFYEGRRDEGLGYNGPGVGPPVMRRTYPNDRDQDFPSRGRLRAYSRGPYGGGRPDQGDYQWGNSQYRYIHQDPYVDDKVVDEKRPLAICVRNLPPWSTETSLREGLFHDYKKHGKVMAVRLQGSGNERFAVVCFKKPEDAEKALDASREKLFFGVKIQVAPHEGVELDESECRAYDVEVDEYHPKATRTLFIGNLEKDVTTEDLKKHFEQFGEIIEIDIKKQSVSTFAFCQYSDIRSVVRAMRQMDGEHLGANRIKLGFGKSMPTRCVWIDGVPENLTEKQLYEQFSRFGHVIHTVIDREKGHALIFYDTEKYASSAVMEMRGRVLNGRKIQIDFASRECQAAFSEHLSKQGPSVPAERPWERREIEKEPGRYEGSTTRYSRYERTRRDGAPFSSRPTSNNRTSAYNSTNTRTRGRYENYDEFPPGRSYDEFSQGSGASYEDSYERELREYAGSQRYGDGVGGVATTNAVSGNSRRHSYSPARRRDDPSPGSQRAHSRDRSSLSPSPRVSYEDGESGGRRTGRRSTSDHDSFHSQSPPGSRTASPPPPARPSKGSSAVTSRLAPPRSPGTPIAASPSREVTLLEDRSLPDPRDYRRRTSDLKDLVVRVSDGRRPTPAAPAESPHRSSAHRLHRSSHTEDGEDVVSSSSGGASGPQDPRLVHRRLTEDPASSGDERPSDQERPHKKPRYNDANYEKVVSVKRLADSSDSNINFRRPHDARREGRVVRRSGETLPHPSRQSEEVHDPRYRRSSVSDADDTHWRRDAIHVSSSCDAPADHSDASPPGTPVRDERDDSSDPLRHTSHHHHHHHHHNHHHHHHRDRYHSVPLSLPLPRFAQQVRAHLSPRAASTSPKGASLLRSPPFSGGVVSAVRGDSREVGSAVVDTPLSPGPRDSPSDSEESPLPSPCSPSIDLEQRIRALDEKYEKWSGSSRVVGNNLPASGNEAGSDNGNSAAVSGNKNARFARILDLEELRSQPSDIVKSLLSKRSVFDEDSKRLENVGDKYEPKPFTSAPRTSRAGSVMPSPPLVNTHLPRLPSTPPAVPSATPISSLPGVRLSSQQAQLQQPVTSSPSQVPRVFVSVPQVSKSQGLSPLHRPAVSQAVRPPASSPGFSPGVSPGVSPAHPPHMSPVTPVSPAPPITTTSSITTATSTTSAVTPLRRAPGTPRAVRLDLPAAAGDVEEVLEEESPGGVVTVVADTRVTGVVSVTESVSSSKSVLTTTSSLQQPLSSPGARPDLDESAPHNVPERRGINSLPLLVKEEPHTEEAEDPVLQRVKVEQPRIEDAKTKDCVREVNECKEMIIAVASESLPSLVKEEPVASETIKNEPLKVESYKPESIKVEPVKVENIKVEAVMKCEANNKELTNNHKRRHSSIENDPRYKVDVKSFEPDSKRVKYDDEEKILREKVGKERRDSRDTRDNKKSEREKKNRGGRREELQENHSDKINNRTCEIMENKQKRKPCENKMEDKKEDTHKKEEKKDKRKEKIEEKPHDKIDPRTLDKICERKNEDRKDNRKEEKKEERKEERRDEKREEKYDDRRDERREEKKEERKDSIREERKDPFREERKDSIREERKDSIREEKKESLREERKESIREERKESIREERKDSIREERKDSLREDRKDSIREERVKSEGDKRRHSEDKKSELREQKHKERKDKFKEKEKLKTSSTSRYEKEAEKERIREKEREREKEKEREREKEEEKEKEREKMLEKEREREREKAIEKEKAAEKEREKMLEREREREKAMEREREKAIEREKMAEREREKVLEKEREKAIEREREKAAEKEREKAVEKDKKKSSEKEREKIDKEKVYEKDRDKVQEKERDRDRDREKDKMRSNERPRDRDKERVPRVNHRDATERADGRRDSRHNNDRHTDKRRDSRHEASVRHHHRSYDSQDTNDTASKHKMRKTRLLDTDEEDTPEASKVSSIHYSSSEDTMMPNHEPCATRIDDSTHRPDKATEALREESEERRVERTRDNRRRKHDSGKSDKSDGEAKSKVSLSRVKTTPPQAVRPKPCLDSHEPQVAPSDVPTSEDEVSRAKVTPASRRNSTSNKSHPQHGRIGGTGQKNKHVNKAKSIFDPETDSCGSLTGSGGEEDGEEEQAPKKHSIFDIPADDGKFDMYDKVKARRLKRQQKQEEERRQQEMKQLQMQKYRQHQRARKEKKSIQPLHSDISDSEEEGDGHNRGQKRGLVRPTSSDEDALRKRRSIHLTSDETDEDSREVKKQMVIGLKKDPKNKLRNILVSDITTDEEVTMNSPNYHSGTRSNCINDESVDMVHSHPGNMFIDSDTESDAHIKRPNKCVRPPESDSEVSDVSSHTKPPKPAARVKVRDKERKPSRIREKTKKGISISKEIITTSEDSDAAMPSEDSRPVRPKVKAEAVEIRHDKTLSQLQRERKRTTESTIVRDKVPSKKDERMEIIFGHISDDSDPSPNLPNVCSASATAKRKGSTSSGTSTAPPPLSPAQTRLTVGEVYDSDSDDLHMIPASSAPKHTHMHGKPATQEVSPSTESKMENKVDSKMLDFKTEERRSIKKERPRHDPPPPPLDGLRTVMEVEKSCSGNTITNNAASPSMTSVNTSPVEENSRTDVKMPVTKEDHEYHDSEASINLDIFRITDEDYSEQRDKERKDRKKKKRQKRDKDGSRGRRHHRRVEEDRVGEHKVDHHGIEHSSLLCLDAASPQSQEMPSPRLLSPQEKVKVDHRAPVPLSSPHSPPVAAQPATPLSTTTKCAPKSPPEPPPHQSPHTHTLTHDTQELVESRESSDICDLKESRSPHPLATLPPDAAESAVQSLTTQVPSSSPSTGNEPIFEDITEASNLSAPESTVDPNAAANGKASRAVISQEETLNAVAGLLAACYNNYSDDASVQPNVEDTIMPPENPAVADDAFEEAQKAAQMLQCEMPGDREDGWSQPPPHNPPTSPVKSTEEPEPQPLVPQEDMEEGQTPEAEEGRYAQLPPDSPGSVQSEPPLQIDEDQPDPTDDGDSSMLTAEDQEDQNNTRHTESESRSFLCSTLHHYSLIKAQCHSCFSFSVIGQSHSASHSHLFCCIHLSFCSSS